MKTEYRILKTKGLYYIQYKHIDYPYGIDLIICFLASFFSKSARNYLEKGKPIWYKCDNIRSHQSLQSAKDRLKELLEPDEIIYI